MTELGVNDRPIELWAAPPPTRGQRLLAFVSLAALTAAWSYFRRAQGLYRASRAGQPAERFVTPTAAAAPVATAPPAVAPLRVAPLHAAPLGAAPLGAAPTPAAQHDRRTAGPRGDAPPDLDGPPRDLDGVAQRNWSAVREAGGGEPGHVELSLAPDLAPPARRTNGADADADPAPVARRTNGNGAHADADADAPGGVATLSRPRPAWDGLVVLPLRTGPLAPGSVPAPDSLPAPGSTPSPQSAPAPAVPSVRRPRERAHLATATRTAELPWVLTVCAVAGLALALRLINHSTNYDVFIDEITYSTIGQSIALGHGVSLFGVPFFLHPPLFFYLEAGALELFGGAHDAPINLVLALRPLDCGLSAIECGLVMLLTARLANRTAAVLAGVYFACDPFLQLWDGRVLLETPAMTLAVLGWLALAAVAQREDARATAAGSPATEPGAGWSSGERTLVVLGGLCFGASLLAKETYAFVGVAPLLAMAVLGSPVRRRVTLTMAALAVGCYAVYLLVIVAEGHWPGFYNQQLAGVLRAVGTKQISGFNQKGHAGFSSRAGADLSLYGVTYVVILAIGLAAAAGVLTWLRTARNGRTLTRQRRLAIALGAGGVGYVTYAVGFGAFETQIFYMSIIAGLPVLATETMAGVRWLASPRLRRACIVAGAVLAGLGLVLELATNVRIRTSRDSDLPELVAYVEHHVAYPSLVDSTDGVTQFVLQGVRIDGPRTVAGVERDKPDYIVIAQGLVDQGYVVLGPGFEQWLHRHAHVVFSADGRTVGRLLLYQTRYATTSRSDGGSVRARTTGSVGTGAGA